FRRNEFPDRRLQLGGNSGHGRDLHEVEIPEQADPEDAGQDVQPAEEEADEGRIEGAVDQEEQSQRQNDAGADGLVEMFEDPCHDGTSLLVSVFAVPMRMRHESLLGGYHDSW